MDGALALVLGQKSRLEVFLNSTLDRLSDAALILGLTTYLPTPRDIFGGHIALHLAGAAMMVSYTRTRAEALDFPCKVGLLTRPRWATFIGALTQPWSVRNVSSILRQLW